jgi:hypothetical protein
MADRAAKVQIYNTTRLSLLHSSGEGLGSKAGCQLFQGYAPRLCYASIIPQVRTMFTWEYYLLRTLLPFVILL